MSRLKGGLIETIFDVSKRAPLDARELVTKYEDLINPSVWIITGTDSETLYDGLTVSVREVGPNMGKYFLTNRKAITQENYDNYKNALNNQEDTSAFFSMWEKLSTEGDILEIIGVPQELKQSIYALLEEERNRSENVDKELSEAIENTIVGAKTDSADFQIVDRQIYIPRSAFVKETEEISISERGDLSINQLDVGKLTQKEGIKLILNGGNANGEYN